MTTTAQASGQRLSGERADLLDALARHRGFLRFTAQDLTDEQANARAAASALTIGGLIKHVAEVERSWAQFAATGEHPGSDEWTDGEGDAAGGPSPEQVAIWEQRFELTDGETLRQQLDEYARVAAATDALIRSDVDLDTTYELPAAPWQPPGVFWSVRRIVLHILAETAQHAGHADIIRENVDGQKTMG